ncbi:predicted protein [Phaeodactylum tricornutum CCAP 1055/1]|jgi:hypothetical protein|uniref:Mitochondrial carrier protein n=1 Tax=Phaeodactylum tricornutum (strain CCAP 1055/1) TaxID=556484 RepID=B7GD97_PHATC|nr:predicted protein [Phaeodactylum tricornutum CCAP 1055/1]EEC43538.1 predicted protein [Phaeodactylum tricornutum CCAP 1055/1]|eukprot:XP_002185091.1 predicted protein [Phaeodactylum tricornutum CCAP 1055/1]
MAGGSGTGVAKEHPWEYLMASALAATINYPLWRASATAQSGFRIAPVHIAGHAIPSGVAPYVYAFLPPYKGMLATVLGMTWARAAIFWGSDYGRDILRTGGWNDGFATVAPPLVVSTAVQCINMPLVRSTITLQNPQSHLRTVSASVQQIYNSHGVQGLWHGTSAGILKTVPKYITAVVVKDWMEQALPPADPLSKTYHQDRLWRSAAKSAMAGVAGAALTNPLDVIRNEMFKTNLGLAATVRHLQETEGYAFVYRGLGKNLIAVAIPVGCTIFFTDAMIQYSST